jgi:replicative DNA helicase
MMQPQSEVDVWIEKRKECEEGLVIACSTLPGMLVELSTIVSESDFRNPFLGKWFGLAVLLNDAGRYSRESLRGELAKFGYLGNTSELSDWARLAWSYIHEGPARYFASELKRLNQLEAIRRLVDAMAIDVTDISIDPLQVIDRATAKLESIYQTSRQRLWELSDDVGKVVIETHRAAMQDRNRIGIPTGFYELDELTGGFFPGQLWQVAGRSYMGKSTVALAFAQEQVDRGNAVYFASYEMTNAELMERILSCRSTVELECFTKGSLTSAQLESAESEAKAFLGSQLFMDDQPPDTVAGIKARVKLASLNAPVKLLVIDHLLLFPHKDRRIPRHQQLVDVTRELKQLAKELELTILLLNQLNIDAEDNEPTDKHYSESKAVLQNLDVSILIHRETKTSEDMLFKVTKNRKGAAGEVRVIFNGRIQKVRSRELSQEWNGGF